MKRDNRKWVVGVVASCRKLATFPTEQDAVAYVGTLPGVEDGRYYVEPDGPEEPC